MLQKLAKFDLYRKCEGSIVDEFVILKRIPPRASSVGIAKHAQGNQYPDRGCAYSSLLLFRHLGFQTFHFQVQIRFSKKLRCLCEEKIKMARKRIDCAG